MSLIIPDVRCWNELTDESEVPDFLSYKHARRAGSNVIGKILEQGGALVLGAHAAKRYRRGTNFTFYEFVSAFISTACRRIGIF